jgi:hypothetical protein
MEITLHKCPNCGKQKIFWLKKRWEESFYCTCSHRKLHNYYDAGYEDYFISLIRSPLSVQTLIDCAQQEYMRVNPAALKIKLEKYDLNNLSEQDFYDVVGIVLSSDDIYRLRLLLSQITDQGQMLSVVANVNPRIDIPKLKTYLEAKSFPLSNNDVVEMEKRIEDDYYHPEIDDVSQWNELLPVIECFSIQMSSQGRTCV